MKKLSKYYITEAASIEDLQKRVKSEEGGVNAAKVSTAASHLTSDKAKNAMWLTAIFVSQCGLGEIKSEFNSILNTFTDSASESAYVMNVIEANKVNDSEEKYKDIKDGSKECTWVIYKTYLAKTIAKANNWSEKLDDANMFLRTFKNSWTESWKEIESDVKNMNENTLPELQNVETKTDEVTNQEQEAAVENTVEKEYKLLDELVKRAGLNKKKLTEYVAMIINRSFKEIKSDQSIEWKKKVAKGEPDDDNFVLGISAMICGAIITGDKNLTKDMFKYLDTKAQDDLKQAQNKLMK